MSEVSVQTRDPLAALLGKGRPLVMGILNVTPDSFSDGGQFFAPTVAIEHAREMANQGADILDIGAESTRPYGGAKPVSAEDELARLKPVLPDVVKLGLPVSIDTIKADVVAFALDAGAAIVNDVWGLQGDPQMASLVAKRDVPVIAMHNRETADPKIDIVADVLAFFARSLEIASQAGIARDKIVLDPGIGFGKTPEQSIICLGRVAAFKRFGLPCSSAPRANASSIRCLRRSRANASGARLRRICSQSRTARGSCACMTCARRCRRCRLNAAIEAAQ